MFPKEKAKELVDKFYMTMYYPTMSSGGKTVALRQAKTQSLIAVDEMIAENENFIPRLEKIYFKDRKDYLKQVKEEILKQ